jgi:hypothetical protein
MLGNNWTARVEWLHYSLGGITDAFTTSPTLGAYGVSWARTLNYDTIRFGLNYRLNWWH